MSIQGLGQEWSVLQNQFDSYEKYSLIIKLISTCVSIFAFLLTGVSFELLLLIILLWGQDSIWKTFQSRIEPRLMIIEKHLAEENNQCAFQFNTQYLENSYKGKALIFEYLRQSIRPTVAFPHAIIFLFATIQFVTRY